MSVHGRIGVPTDRDNTYVVEINADGSLNVRSRTANISPLTPTRVFIGNTAAVLVSANTSRRSLYVYNNGTDPVYLGFSTAITINDGIPLYPHIGVVFRGLTEALYGISNVASVDMRVLEMNEV